MNRTETVALANRFGYQLFRASESGRQYKVQNPHGWTVLKHAWILFANPTRYGWKHFRTLKAVTEYLREHGGSGFVSIQRRECGQQKTTLADGS